MNYSDAIAQLRQENVAGPYPEEEYTNFVIAREVGGALAEGFGNRIEFDTFDNCREWGLTFTAGDWTFCCYEHRNSDEIHIEGCPTTEMQLWGPYGGEDKFDTIFFAGWQQYQTITRALTAVLDAALQGHLLNRAHTVLLTNQWVEA